MASCIAIYLLIPGRLIVSARIGLQRCAAFSGGIASYTSRSWKSCPLAPFRKSALRNFHQWNFQPFLVCVVYPLLGSSKPQCILLKTSLADITIIFAEAPGVAASMIRRNCHTNILYCTTRPNCHRLLRQCCTISPLCDAGWRRSAIGIHDWSSSCNTTSRSKHWCRSWCTPRVGLRPIHVCVALVHIHRSDPCVVQDR